MRVLQMHVKLVDYEMSAADMKQKVLFLGRDTPARTIKFIELA